VEHIAPASGGLGNTSDEYIIGMDVERAFSEGRNQVNWNQQTMTSQTFRSQMCTGLWYKAPWFSLDHAEDTIDEEARPLRRNGSSP